MRIDDLSAPSGRFVARVSASVVTVDRCPGRGRALPAADTSTRCAVRDYWCTVRVNNIYGDEQTLKFWGKTRMEYKRRTAKIKYENESTVEVEHQY